MIIIMMVMISTLGVVSASELVEHNFDGKFTALAPDDGNFKEGGGFSYNWYTYENQKISYLYGNFTGLGDNIEYIYSFLETEGFQKVNSDGNLTIFKIDNDDYGNYGVGVIQGDEFVCIAGDNLDQLEKIGNSVKFI